MIPKTKAERVKQYRQLIKEQEANGYLKGICIHLGNICGGFGKVPWVYWNELVKYYPELAVYPVPKRSSCFFYTTERKGYSKSKM